MKESIKTRIKIKTPWVPEFVDYYHGTMPDYYHDPNTEYNNELFLRFNMINTETGEIRQKTVTLDYIARHLFKNIETEKR